MTFQNVLRQVLETERRGKRRLEAAREDAGSILERARNEAARLRREAQRDIAEEKARRVAHTREEIAAEIARSGELTETEIQHLRALAARKRDRTVLQVLSWIREQR